MTLEFAAVGIVCVVCVAQIANDLEFFRMEPGRPHVPYIFDDGDIDEMKMKTTNSTST